MNKATKFLQLLFILKVIHLEVGRQFTRKSALILDLNVGCQGFWRLVQAG